MYVGINGFRPHEQRRVKVFFLQNTWMKNIKERKWVCRYCSCYVAGVSLTECISVFTECLLWNTTSRSTYCRCRLKDHVRDDESSLSRHCSVAFYENPTCSYPPRYMEHGKIVDWSSYFWPSRTFLLGNGKVRKCRREKTLQFHLHQPIYSQKKVLFISYNPGDFPTHHFSFLN